MQTPATPTPARTDAAKPAESHVAARIREAAEATGVPFEFLLAQANQESRLDPEARSRRSSATGLFQFTAGTWLEMVKKHGDAHGLDRYADAIGRDADGRWSVKDKAMRKEILDLRRDAKTSALMAAEYARDNGKILEAKLGRPASSHDLYLAHFLGAGGATRVLKGMESHPLRAAAGVLPAAARANPEVFREPDGNRPRSLAGFYQAVHARFTNALKDVAPMARQMQPRVDLAELRPEARPVAAPAPLRLAEAEPPLVEAFVTPMATGQSAGPALADTGRPAQSFPVRLPPPVAVTRVDSATMRGLLEAMEKQV